VTWHAEMLVEILITGLFRTFVEIIPFAAVVAIELRGTPYQRIYQNQFDSVKHAAIMPKFTNPNGDDEDAVKEVAMFSSVAHDTQKYSAYSSVVITVIFFSKVPTILTLPADTTIQIGIFGIGVVLWAVATYLLFRWRSSAEQFYNEFSPFNYFRANDDDLYYRSVTIPFLAKMRLPRDQADLLLVNSMPIFVVLVFNSVLIGASILVPMSGSAL
jgi:hypothetical protein